MTLLPGAGMRNRETTGDGGSFASHITWRHFVIIYLFLRLLFWPRRMACGILVPRPGIEPMPPAMQAWSPNHWTAREDPWALHFI